MRGGLALMGKHPDGKCEDRETVKHVLLQCKLYSKEGSFPETWISWGISF
jgi:hypothetical protein